MKNNFQKKVGYKLTYDGLHEAQADLVTTVDQGRGHI